MRHIGHNSSNVLYCAYVVKKVQFNSSFKRIMLNTIFLLIYTLPEGNKKIIGILSKLSCMSVLFMDIIYYPAIISP